MIEFYKRGDCEGLISAEKQLKNKDEWENNAKIEYWKSVKEAMIEKINQLWRLGGEVDFYEEDWFPGYNLFLKDLQANGYHVYEGKEERKEIFYGTPQKRFIISLYEINDPYGIKVIREINKDE